MFAILSQQKTIVKYIVMMIIVLFIVTSIHHHAIAEDSQKPSKQAEEKNKKKAAKAPPAKTHYQGREIARTMHYTGAPWLIRSGREREERASELLKQLKLKPGQTVCDIGCGNGYHSLKMAKIVGKKGKVLAVDIQIQMLRLLQQRAKEKSITNIETVHSLPHFAKLPEGKLDLILLVDVYHEFSHPQEMLKVLRKALKPTGRIALVEFRTEDPKVPIKKLHKMSKKQILKEFPPNGFKLVEQYDKLPWQHLMFFERDDVKDDQRKDKK